MKFIHSFLLLTVAGIMSIQAQTKSFTLHDLTPGGKTYEQFKPADLKNAGWCGDTFIFTQDEAIIATDKNGKPHKKQLITLANLNKALEANQLKPLKGLPAFTFPKESNPETVHFFAENKVLTYDFKKNQITHILPYDEKDGGFDFNDNRTMVAVNNGNQLFVIDAEGNRTEVSSGNEADIIWGQAVHRNEFGIHKGTFWSPDGKLLAFYRMDQSMVADYPLVDISARIAKAENIKYPMAGMTSHEVTLGVFNPKTGKIVYLETGEPKDHYLTNISWTPDNQSILIAELNREQNEMTLNRYDAQSGKKMYTLFSEKSDKYVEPENPAFFLPQHDDLFIWQSERDGFNHMYLYNLKGELQRQLTSGEWIVSGIVRADNSGNKIYYTSTEESPLESHLYQLDLKSGKRIRLTTLGEGVHFTKLNASGSWFYDRYSSLKNPGTSILQSTGSKKSTALLQAENPYMGYAMPEIEIGSFKADDQTTDLYYRLTKPVDFDPEKKYPTVIYLYNGPHAQLVNNSWMGAIRGWDIYMAQKGYVVFTIDGRGSANRGRDFEQAIHQHLGEQEGKDQMKGIEFLSSLPYVDTARIGIHGWSYGGFMTTYMLLTYPEIFKVGVAGGPVIDWSLYEVMYGERYMGQPAKNVEGYKNANLLNKAQNLQGRLLMIHGDMDPVVVMQHSLQFLKKSVEVGVYPDYFIYPGHEHNVRGIDRVHLHEKISRYFDDYLK